MNGKEYVIKAIELSEQIISEINASDLFEDASMLEEMAKACKDLGKAKTKATLRTKVGTNMAFPVYDAAQNCAEAWEEVQEQNDVDELNERMEEFITSVDAFSAALKERTVIMT